MYRPTCSARVCLSSADSPSPALALRRFRYLEPAMRAVARARGRQRVAAARALSCQPCPAVGAVLPVGWDLSLAALALLHEPAEGLEVLREPGFRLRPLRFLLCHLLDLCALYNSRATLSVHYNLWRASCVTIAHGVLVADDLYTGFG